MSLVLPHDDDAEHVLLGNCIASESPAPLLGVDPILFFRDHNQQVAREILAMAKASEPITLTRLAQRLQRRVAASYISALPDGVPVSLDLNFYRRKIIECATNRHAAAAADALSRAYLTGDAVQIKNAHDKLAAVTATNEIGRGGKAARVELVDSSNFVARTSTDERPHLIKGLIPAESHSMWQGRPKTGKSHSLLQLAFDASSGLPVFNKFAVHEPVRVGYVELEEPESETKKRFAAMIRAHDGKGPEAGRLWFFSREDLYRLRLLPHELLTTKIEALAEAITGAGIELLILIALRKFVLPGQSLKDPEVAECINSGLCELRQRTKAAIVIGHHDRKSPAATVEALGFGSTMLGAEVDGVFDLRRRGDGLREVCFEGRFRVEEETFCLELSTQGDGELITHVPWHGEDKAREAELRRRVDAGETVNHAAAELNIPKSTAYNWMKP
jgi:hypothetical protein